MDAKKIVISINAAWNIVNFRLGLIRALREAGHEVIALAPPDDYGARLEALGIPYVPIADGQEGRFAAGGTSSCLAVTGGCSAGCGRTCFSAIPPSRTSTDRWPRTRSASR